MAEDEGFDRIRERMPSSRHPAGLPRSPALKWVQIPPIDKIIPNTPRVLGILAEDEGFEPPQTESESGVLPLHKSSMDALPYPPGGGISGGNGTILPPKSGIIPKNCGTEIFRPAQLIQILRALRRSYLSGARTARDSAPRVRVIRATSAWPKV